MADGARGLAARGAACACVLALGGCGGDGAESAGEDPFRAVERQLAEPREERAGPRWERVAALDGSGDGVRSFEIDRGAIQWRARWSCDGPAFAIHEAPLPAGSEHPGRRPCRRGSIDRIGDGSRSVEIHAEGSWRVTIEQQVDTPLHEAPLPAMRARGAREVARGSFYGIEHGGRGRATLHRVAGGRLALRLEGFATSANTDLYVWISENPRPRTSRQAIDSPYVEIAPLKSTIGDQNDLLPRGFDLSRARSVVIWCEPIRIAYTAAALGR